MTTLITRDKTAMYRLERDGRTLRRFSYDETTGWVAPLEAFALPPGESARVARFAPLPLPTRQIAISLEGKPGVFVLTKLLNGESHLQPLPCGQLVSGVRTAQSTITALATEERNDLVAACDVLGGLTVWRGVTVEKAFISRGRSRDASTSTVRRFEVLGATGAHGRRGALAMEFCARNPELLVTCGSDGLVKVWKVRFETGTRREDRKGIQAMCEWSSPHTLLPPRELSTYSVTSSRGDEDEGLVVGYDDGVIEILTLAQTTSSPRLERKGGWVAGKGPIRTASTSMTVGAHSEPQIVIARELQDGLNEESTRVEVSYFSGGEAVGTGSRRTFTFPGVFEWFDVVASSSSLSSLDVSKNERTTFSCVARLASSPSGERRENSHDFRVFPLRAKEGTKTSHKIPPLTHAGEETKAPARIFVKGHEAFSMDRAVERLKRTPVILSLATRAELNSAPSQKHFVDLIPVEGPFTKSRYLRRKVRPPPLNPARRKPLDQPLEGKLMARKDDDENVSINRPPSFCVSLPDAGTAPKYRFIPSEDTAENDAWWRRGEFFLRPTPAHKRRTDVGGEDVYL